MAQPVSTAICDGLHKKCQTLSLDFDTTARGLLQKTRACVLGRMPFQRKLAVSGWLCILFHPQGQILRGHLWLCPHRKSLASKPKVKEAQTEAKAEAGGHLSDSEDSDLE